VRETDWENKFNSLLQEIEDGYYECDLKGNTLLYNQAMCGIFGYTFDEIQGGNVRDFRPHLAEDDYGYVRRIYDQVYRTGCRAEALHITSPTNKEKKELSRTLCH